MAYWLGYPSNENQNVSDAELLAKVNHGLTVDGFLPIDDYTQASPFIEGGEDLKNLLTEQYRDLGLGICVFSVDVNIDVGTKVI